MAPRNINMNNIYLTPTTLRAIYYTASASTRVPPMYCVRVQQRRKKRLPIPVGAEVGKRSWRTCRPHTFASCTRKSKEAIQVRTHQPT